MILIYFVVYCGLPLDCVAMKPIESRAFNVNATTNYTDHGDSTMGAMKNMLIEFEESLDFVSLEALEDSATDLMERFTTCHCCHDIIARDDATSYDDHHLCEDCLTHEYFTCAHCDEITPNGDETTVDGESWCESCRSNDATRCCDCPQWSADEHTIGYSHGSLCETCYENHYFTCEECNEVCHNDHYHGDGYCDDCRSNDPDNIMDYSTDILDIIPTRLDKSKIYFGVELEVIATSGDVGCIAYDCRDILGTNFAITKHDGSLGSRGFELVTIPTVIAKHAKRWEPLLDSPPRGLRSWDNPKCGMHVHVSRAPLSALTIGKVLVFINADENKKFVVSIAGRESGYAEISPKKIVDANRYCGSGAINLGNEDTIEFRIFKGTLKKTSFMKNLEFVAATVQVFANGLESTNWTCSHFLIGSSQCAKTTLTLMHG